LLIKSFARRRMLMNQRLLCTVAFAAIFMQNVRAGTNTVYNFLRSDVDPRAAAMGGSFVSVLDDPNSLFYNPAGLSTLESPKGSLGFVKHLLDINSGYVSYSQKIEESGNIGAGIIYTNYGSFDRTDVTGTVLGTFSAGDLAILLGYSNLLEENFYYGINVKYIHSSIAEYSSSAVAADIGVLYNIPESRVTLGASLRNAGVQLSKYGSVKEDLPVDLVVGGSVVPRGLPLLLNVSFHKLTDATESFGDHFKTFKVGGEFQLSPSFRLRFGYDNEKRTDLKVGSSSGLAGISGGVGIGIGEYRLDYALSSLGTVGDLHRVSIGATF
jgi:hypothetical protein